MPSLGNLPAPERLLLDDSDLSCGARIQARFFIEGKRITIDYAMTSGPVTLPLFS
jgi:hypothetical protein